MRSTIRYTIAVLILHVVTFLILYGMANVSDEFREKIHGATDSTPLTGFVNWLLPDAHDHGHGSEAPAAALTGEIMEVLLSEQALKNSGIDDNSLMKVNVGTFGKTLSFPAMVIDRPGRSLIKLPSPVSGVVTKIHADPGVSVNPGDPIFEITLTRQDLVQTQTDLITLLQRRDIIDMELERLDQIGSDIAPKSKREVAFQKKENESNIENQRNLLRLQGISDTDITETIENNRKIVQTLIVRVPHAFNDEDDADHATGASHPMQINELLIEMGQQVVFGEPLCVIGDLCQLVIEGKAFAYDEPVLLRALTEKQSVSIWFEGYQGSREKVENLRLRSVENRIDAAARTLACFVELPNKILLDEILSAGDTGSLPRRFITWQFKPGQRCELNVQYETLINCIVLPVEAVAKELNETSVFEWVGSEEGRKIWSQRPVHLLHQTKSYSVIANDGSIFPEAIIASKGATFLLNALNASRLKPKGDAGGGVVHGDHVH